MNRVFICIFLLICTFSSKAQFKTYIGAEAAYSADFYKYWDTQARVTHPDVSAALWGLNLRHYFLKELLFFETGVYSRAFKVGLAFDNNYGTQSTDRTGYFMPLRVGATLPIIKKALAVSPLVGINFGAMTKSTLTRLSGTHSQENKPKITYNNTIFHYKSSLALFQAGVGIDIRLWPRAILQLSTNYYEGTGNIQNQEFRYTVEGHPMTQKGNQTSKGSFYTVGIGLKYAVDWF